MADADRAAGPSGDLRVPPRRLGSARTAFFRAVEEVAAALGGRRFYRRRFLAEGRFDVRRERVLVDDLPAGLAGFRIAQLSDLHAGSFLGPGDLRHVVARVNAEAVDLVVLTGDLITRDWREATLLLDDWRRLEARHGVLAVFGNHDYRHRQEGRIVEAYGEVGIRFLRNECRRIDTGDGVLGVVGLEDLEEGRVVDAVAARAGLRSDDVEIVLCHNPLGAPALARPGCAAVLSGHTHGHQIDLPGVRSLAPHHPGDRVALGGTALIVSRGLGVVCVPLRVGARAEVVVVELVAREARSGAA